MAKIIVHDSEGRREFELGTFTTVGRHPDNVIQILDRIVSKEHAHIIRQSTGRFLYKDLGSLNGTFLRGERVGEHVLSEGDELALGSTKLLFESRASDAVLQQVTIDPAANESLIRQKLQSRSREFLPEKQITDVESLRRDYEKL